MNNNMSKQELEEIFKKRYPHFKYGCVDKQNKHGLTCDEMFHRWLNEDDYKDPIYNNGETWSDYPISNECLDILKTI